MSEPEYVVCLECETPCYAFEWDGDKLVEILCPICGNETPDQFARPEDLEDLYCPAVPGTWPLPRAPRGSTEPVYASSKT